MAQHVSQDELVRLRCICGHTMQISPELLGRVFTCPSCSRSLRTALQFILADESIAPNITVACPCGRFVVEEIRRVGKQVQCRACGRKLILPRPVDKPGAPAVVRVPPEALKSQLRRTQTARRRSGDEVGASGGSGATALLPGQKACANPECRAPMSKDANICAKCGTNFKTGVAYEGRGPEDDPVGKWRTL